MPPHDDGRPERGRNTEINSSKIAAKPYDGPQTVPVSARNGVIRGVHLIKATDLATIYEACLGMGKTQTSEILKSPQELRWYRQAYPETRRRIEDLLSEQRKFTDRLIFAERCLLDGLARELVAKKVMSGTEIQAFVRDFRGYAPDAQVWPLRDQDAAE